MHSPDAIAGSHSAFWASLAPWVRAPAPSTADAKKGAQSSDRPISSSAIPSSTGVKPWPPYASGRWTPGSASSPQSCFHTSGS